MRMTTTGDRRRYGVIETRYRHHSGIAYYTNPLSG
jgi:hypothetical protein